MSTIPGGRNKGLPIAEADDRELEYWSQNARDPAIKAAAAAELNARLGGGSSSVDPGPAAAVAAPTAIVEGTFGDPAAVSDALARASASCNLMSPATSCGTLPDGFEVMFSVIHVDPTSPDLYPLSGGKMGLDRTTLAKLASGAGVTVIDSRRTDDGRDPHYCAWQCVIEYRQFDGAFLRRVGNVEIDTRAPAGTAYVEIMQKAAASERGRDPQKQLLELRKFITRHAESKALNRAIAAMGLKRSYTAAELQKPFVMAKLAFTGRSDDPVAREIFLRAIADNAMGARRQLYSPPTPVFTTSGTSVDDGGEW